MIRNSPAIYKYFTYILLLLISISCDRRVELDLGDFKSKVAVHTILTPDSTFNVLLTKSRFILSELVSDTIVEAAVRVYEGEELLSELTIQSDALIDDLPIFKSEIAMPKVGNTYSLVIDVPDEEELTAETTIPQEFSLNGLQIKDIDTFLVDRVGEETLELFGEFWIDNPDEGHNFYHVTEAELTFDWFQIINGDTVITEAGRTVVLPIENNDIANRHFQSLTHVRGFLIEEAFRDDPYISIPFKLSVMATSSFELLSEIKVVVRHVAPEYHDYHNRIALQAERAKNPLENQVPVSSNVKNGLGNFSGFVSLPVKARFEFFDIE